MVAAAQTMAFTGIILIEQANVLNFRSFTLPLSSIGYFTNPWLLLAIAVSLGLQIAAVYVPFLQSALRTVPLGIYAWIVLIAVAAPIFVVSEIFRLWKSQGRTNEKG